MVKKLRIKEGALNSGELVDAVKEGIIYTKVKFDDGSVSTYNNDYLEVVFIEENALSKWLNS